MGTPAQMCSEEDQEEDQEQEYDGPSRPGERAGSRWAPHWGTVLGGTPYKKATLRGVGCQYGGPGRTPAWRGGGGESDATELVGWSTPGEGLTESLGPSA